MPNGHSPARGPECGQGLHIFKPDNGYFLTEDPIPAKHIIGVTVRETGERVESEKDSPPLPSRVLQAYLRPSSRKAVKRPRAIRAPRSSRDCSSRTCLFAIPVSSCLCSPVRTAIRDPENPGATPGGKFAAQSVMLALISATVQQRSTAASSTAIGAQGPGMPCKAETGHGSQLP